MGAIMSVNRVARSRRRRASDFAVLRWLSVGAAGVGVGVAAWAGTAVAAADAGGSPSDSSSASQSSSTGKSSAESGRSAHRPTKTGSAPSAAAARSGLNARTSVAPKATAPSAASASSTSSPLVESNSADQSDSTAADLSATPVDPTTDAVTVIRTERSRGTAAKPVASAESMAATVASSSASAQAVSEDVDETPTDIGWVTAERPSIKELVDGVIYNFLDAVTNVLSKFPSNPITDFLQGAWLTMRRTFFNQAPTLNPSQTTGQDSGEITGTLGAVDPEDDSMMFSVLQSPLEGTVILNPDGTFTYTPGADFDGRDVFIVAARNTDEPALNVLDLFGNGITQALVIVEQGSSPQIDYAFTYNDSVYGFYVQHWSDEAKIGLSWAAYYLADQIVPYEDVTLTFTATAQYLMNNNLASAGSNLTSKDPGFFPTVVQSRIQTGSPSVTKDGQPVADGRVTVNFYKNWGYEGVVGEGQFDYESVMLHELMHAYGFLSDVRSAGNNGGVNQNWSTFDKFITNNNGTVAVNPTTYAWNREFDPNLTGGNGGLYFYGPNEAAAFNDEGVPLYTPPKWEGGSSVSHLNDAYFNNKTEPNNPRYIQLMNAKDDPGIKAPNYLSAVEIGILKDIGYTMA